jgi:hypothetical protein
MNNTFNIKNLLLSLLHKDNDIKKYAEKQLAIAITSDIEYYDKFFELLNDEEIRFKIFLYNKYQVIDDFREKYRI